MRIQRLLWELLPRKARPQGAPAEGLAWSPEVLGPRKQREPSPGRSGAGGGGRVHRTGPRTAPHRRRDAETRPRAPAGRVAAGGWTGDNQGPAVRSNGHRTGRKAQNGACGKPAPPPGAQGALRDTSKMDSVPEWGGGAQPPAATGGQTRGRTEQPQWP